ncbi:unnamed protein product [Chilo suppressalis]|uniref:Peptidase S1 domain-containing protein n=1 Tax=Chilo suppressalis TaxID=168631 RepID=A0ABN8L542_CHISP|nr:unnamed protein product [Chilo suppressalis]
MKFLSVCQNIHFSIILFLLLVLKKCDSQVFEQPIKVDENHLVPRVVSGCPAKLGDVPYQFTIDPFTFNDYISSIPYASKYKDYKGECLTSGYGKLNKPFSEKKLKSDKLMLANLAIIPAYWCSKKHRKNMRHFICTSDKVTDVGKGDSGGPLVCAKTGDPNDKGEGIVVGIVSGNKLYSGSFFTRVSSFSNYIDRNNANNLLLSAIVYIFPAINILWICLFCLSLIVVISTNIIKKLWNYLLHRFKTYFTSRKLYIFCVIKNHQYNKGRLAKKLRSNKTLVLC